MSNPKLGNKHSCKGCDARFFDMKKSPIVCPKCGLEIKEPKAPKGKRPVPEIVPAPATKAELLKAATMEDADGKEESDDIDDELAELIPDDDDVDEETLDDDEDDDDLIEDASDLGEDDDDLLEVREHIVDDGALDKG